jgi:two-component system OmpR family response regulator
VVILTSRKTWREKVMGLRAGADDYLGKPFEYEELQARLEAVIRRSGGHARSVLSHKGLVIDPANARVTLDGAHVDLTAQEYRTLEFLMQHSGEIVSKTQLTEHIYHRDFDLDSNVIEVLINRLRRKLRPDLIRTRRGLGYQIGGDENDA